MINQKVEQLSSKLRGLFKDRSYRQKEWILAASLSLLLLITLFFPEKEQEPDFGGLPDFAAIKDVREMKGSFFDYLLPIIEYHNHLVTQQRGELLEFADKINRKSSLSSRQLRKLQRLAQEYDVAWEETDPEQIIRALLLRIDVIPAPLALVQAAKESGWGRSRFAKQGNNLFGQWCFSPGCGIVPKNRPAGETYEVAHFDSVSVAVGKYVHNLNTNENYAQFRRMRADMRKKGAELNASQLAEGLIFYSQRRQAYVDEVRSMIRQYHQFNSARANT